MARCHLKRSLAEYLCVIILAKNAHSHITSAHYICLSRGFALGVHCCRSGHKTHKPISKLDVIGEVHVKVARIKALGAASSMLDLHPSLQCHNRVLASYTHVRSINRYTIQILRINSTDIRNVT